MTKHRRYSPEFRARAVCFVQDVEPRYPTQRSAIAYIAENLGCPTRLLRDWVRKAEVEAKRARLTADERRRLIALARENRELRISNDRLRNISAFFARAATEHTPLWPAIPIKRRSTRAPREGSQPQDTGKRLTAAVIELYRASLEASAAAAAEAEAAAAEASARAAESASDDDAYGEPALAAAP